MKRPLIDQRLWRRQLPDAEPSIGRCDFLFDAAARDYDWLVVYDELPPAGERLACPRSNTLLVTAEPSSIKVYGQAYLRQFGAVLTSQEPWALQHPGVIRRMPALRWFYGWPHQAGSPILTRDLIARRSIEKDRLISATCSEKRMGHTFHRARYDFVMALKQAIPEMDVFGRGIRPMNDKAEALDRYRYHVAIENHLAPHHITEKLTDAYLGGAMPLYFGAPNAGDYYPRDSFVAIDIRNIDRSIEAVRRAIASDVYENGREALDRAKRLVLERDNLFAVLAEQIDRLDTGDRGDRGDRLISRRGLRRRNPLIGAASLVERWRVRARLRRANQAASESHA